MKLEFNTRKMEKACSNESKMRAEWGDRVAKCLMRRLQDLEAAHCLADIRNLPGNCHELTGDRKGQLTIYLGQPYRLIFTPANNPIPRNADGGLDWKSVTAVQIQEIVDYH